MSPPRLESACSRARGEIAPRQGSHLRKERNPLIFSPPPTLRPGAIRCRLPTSPAGGLCVGLTNKESGDVEPGGESGGGCGARPGLLGGRGAGAGAGRGGAFARPRRHDAHRAHRSADALRRERRRHQAQRQHGSLLHQRGQARLRAPAEVRARLRGLRAAGGGVFAGSHRLRRGRHAEDLHALEAIPLRSTEGRSSLRWVSLRLVLSPARDARR